MRPDIDFAAIAAAALSSADRLVPEWLPEGRRNGHEWQARNPTRSDSKIGSFSINLKTGVWADFATDEKGGDLISLRAYLSGGKQVDAARELAERFRITSEAPPAPREKTTASKTPWSPIVPVPSDAGAAPVAHMVRGKPERSWVYHDQAGAVLGYVHRFKTSDGGKEILPCVYAKNASTGERGWRWMQWSEPRPLYGLNRLRDGRPVLVVEGEKCADAAHQLLGETLDVLTWPAGSKAMDKADWRPLRGRRVILWPDCDAQNDRAGKMLPAARQPGIVAMEKIASILSRIDCEVRIVEIPAPGERPSGWDIADAIEEGADAAALQAMLMRLRKPAGEPSPTAAARAGSGDGDWRDRLLRRRGEIDPCLSNVTRILANDDAWRDLIVFDEFSWRTIRRGPVPGHKEPPGDRDWTDVDTSRTTIWLTNHYSITPSSSIVDEAINVIARSASIHPVRSYLESLAWDGTERVPHWLADYLGVQRTEYTTRVATWFLIGMIARVFEPGCKFDYCLVLEGKQGLRKSTALRVLAGEWFSDTELDLTNKDAMSAIRGKWLHEFSEMGSIARAEATRQKSFLSRQVDEFRPTYGRREIRCERQLVFAGSTNDWQWNKDSTGGRRFWPVEVSGEIDTDGLSAMRDQLFAEALYRYRQRERYWPTGDEQRTLFDPEQLARQAEDAIEDPIHDWIEELPRAEFTLHEVLSDALKLDAGRITRDVMTRTGQVLKRFGCTRVERRNGVSRFVYQIPAWAKYAQAQELRNQVRNSDGPLPL